MHCWIAQIAASWMTLEPTDHQAECECCTTLSRSLDVRCDEFIDLLGETWTKKRVARTTCKIWANMTKDASFLEVQNRMITDFSRIIRGEVEEIPLGDMDDQHTERQLAGKLDAIALAAETELSMLSTKPASEDPTEPTSTNAEPSQMPTVNFTNWANKVEDEVGPPPSNVVTIVKNGQNCYIERLPLVEDRTMTGAEISISVTKLGRFLEYDTDRITRDKRL